MQPIVLKTVNAKGESEYGTKDGFKPNFLVTDNTIPYKNLGDPQETLLKVAIENITGKPVSMTQNNARQGASRKVEILNSAYPLDNPQREIRDMWINKLPGQK